MGVHNGEYIIFAGACVCRACDIGMLIICRWLIVGNLCDTMRGDIWLFQTVKQTVSYINTKHHPVILKHAALCGGFLFFKILQNKPCQFSPN